MFYPSQIFIFPSVPISSFSLTFFCWVIAHTWYFILSHLRSFNTGCCACNLRISAFLGGFFSDADLVARTSNVSLSSFVHLFFGPKKKLCFEGENMNQHAKMNDINTKGLHGETFLQKHLKCHFDLLIKRLIICAVLRIPLMTGNGAHLVWHFNQRKNKCLWFCCLYRDVKSIESL